MNIDGKIDPIVALPQMDRLKEKRPDSSKESSNVQEDPARVKLSELARDYSKAVQRLKEDEEIRPEEVDRGKAIIKNWEPPTDEEVDVIINKVIDEV